MPRNAPALPQQALPADKRKQEAPAPFTEVLPSGLMVTWRMPDPFKIIAFDGDLPDPLTSAVIRLLSEERSYTPDADPRKFRTDAAAIRGMYGLAAAMLVEPKLDPTVEYGQNGTLGRREIGYLDVATLHFRFRIGTRLPAPVAPDPAEPDRPADAPPDSDGVPPDAGGAAGGD